MIQGRQTENIADPAVKRAVERLDRRADSVRRPGRVSHWFWGQCPGWAYPLDGRALSVTAEPELFAAIGYAGGGSGDTFLLPTRTPLDGGIFIVEK